MVRVLVTGANGYIGGATARALRAAGHHVYGLIRNAANSGKLLKSEILPVIGTIDSIVVDPFSVIVDTATGLSPAEGKVSRGLFEKVAAWNASHPITQRKLYVYTSGCMTYGDHPNEVVVEDTPSNNGDAWRLEVEGLVLSGGGVVLRPGWVYGESGGVYAAPWFDIPDLKAPIVVKGNPNKMWTWVHITDLADAYVKVLAASYNTVSGQLFNVGDATRLTFEKVLEMMARAAGSEGKLVYEPATSPWFEVTSIMDCSKIYRMLGWKPSRTSFADAMPLYFASWKSHKASKAASAASVAAAAPAPAEPVPKPVAIKPGQLQPATEQS